MKFCANCGAKLKEDAEVCLSCGKKVEADKDLDKTSANNKYAVVGFSISMASLLINFCGIVGLLGLIFSSVGLSQISNKPEERGKGFAIAGLVVGIFSLLYGIIVTVNLFLN